MLHGSEAMRIGGCSDLRYMSARSPTQVYYSVFDLDERYWVYNYNLFYRCPNVV
jgi:hypothetical protein